MSFENFTKPDEDYFLKSTIEDGKFVCIQKVQKKQTTEYFIKKTYFYERNKISINYDCAPFIHFLINMQNTKMPFPILESLSLSTKVNPNYSIMTKYMQKRDLQFAINSANSIPADLMTSWDISVNRQVELDDASPPTLDETQLMKTVYGVAFGLNYMHQNKIVHGNIKPSSILFSDECHPLITDFVFDKPIILNEEYQNSCSNDDLIYIAPEVITNKQLSIKSDIYSFSVVVLKLLDNEFTFGPVQKLLNPFIIKPDILKDFIKSDQIYNVPSKIPHEFSQLLIMNLSHDPEKRTSMQDFVDYLKDPNSPLIFQTCNVADFRDYIRFLDEALTEITQEPNLNNDEITTEFDF